MASIQDDYQATASPENPKKIISPKNKRSQIAKILIIVLVTAISVVFTIVDVVVTAQNLKQQNELKNNIIHGIHVSEIIHNLQNERSLTTMLSLAWNTTKNILHLKKIRESTDESIQVLLEWRYTLPGLLGETISNSASFLNEIRYFRSKIDNGDELMAHDHINIFSTWIHELITWLAHYTVTQDIQTHTDDLFAYHMIVNTKEELELEKIFGSIYFLRGENASFQNITSYNDKRVRAHAFLETALLFSSVVKKHYDSLIKDLNATTWLADIEAKRNYLVLKKVKNSSNHSAKKWFEFMTKYGDLMVRLETEDASRIQSHVEDLIRSSILWLIIRSLLVCFAVITVPFIIISLVKVQNKFYKYAYSLHHKVGLEQSRTDFLMRENARHVQDLASRWKQFSQTNSENRAVAENDKDVPS
ncbi:uncharacterized protein LOC114535682 [Dendronephthya gigantea]|uniref:uncharacterized protein LOC114535682 n=1 Tax=Dendronephthya gigantea TaxID=151771 RepID=UPI00106905A1|nr:uncharacterized protein LOC114535682 [Dendronephthya gigantea]XP_028412781.1 uncharacterized protein LOC114535682 [Dendronephthya gigantea]